MLLKKILCKRSEIKDSVAGSWNCKQFPMSRGGGAKSVRNKVSKHMCVYSHTLYIIFNI